MYCLDERDITEHQIDGVLGALTDNLRMVLHYIASPSTLSKVLLALSQGRGKFKNSPVLSVRIESQFGEIC